MDAIVIAGFPGVGKTYLFNEIGCGDMEGMILDSDSSSFSWIQNENGDKVRNPEFPKNYIQHIKDNLSKAKIILISTHKEVLQEMNDSGIKYIIVSPDLELKEEMIGRYFLRGSGVAFCELLRDNFETWIGDIHTAASNADRSKVAHLVLDRKSPYLNSVLTTIDEIYKRDLFKYM